MQLELSELELEDAARSARSLAALTSNDAEKHPGNYVGEGLRNTAQRLLTLAAKFEKAHALYQRGQRPKS